MASSGCCCCGDEPPSVIDTYAAVTQDKQIKAKLDAVKKYALGEHNQARRIRDLSSVLPMYLELNTTCWPFWSFLWKIFLLAGNVTAIFFAFLTYKAPAKQGWQFQVPSQAVVWLEFLGICWYLLWTLYGLVRFLGSVIQEARSTPENLYLRNLEVCSRLRLWYKASMKLQFNLLMFLRYVSPPAVLTALYKARKRVYRNYGTRVQRQNCCLDMLCCCCFYGRLWCCSLAQYVFVLLCAALCLLLVLLKVLQLRFLGEVNIRNWSITELLLFGQFVINIATLDTRQRAKMKGKLELIFNGADAEEALGERKAKSMFENLALLVVRYHRSLCTALVMYHSLNSDDVSYLYIQDDVEEEKPRNRVWRKKQEKKKPSGSSGGGADAGGGRDQDHWPPPPHAGGPPPNRPYPMQQYDNPEWVQYPGYGPAEPTFNPAAAPPPMHGTPNPLYPGHVVVTMSPRRSPGGPSAAAPPPPQPQPPPPPPPQYAQPQQPPGGPPGRFPYAFYDNGHAVGAPLNGWAAQPTLKSKYEQVLWGVQAT